METPGLNGFQLVSVDGSAFTVGRACATLALRKNAHPPTRLHITTRV